MDKENPSVQNDVPEAKPASTVYGEKPPKYSAWKERFQDWLFLFGPFVVLIIIFIAGIFFVLREFFPSLFEGNEAVVVERAGNYIEPLNPSQLPTPDELINRVLIAHGGRQALSGLNSIQMNGTIRVKGQTYKFYLTRKKPGRALLKIKSDQQEVTDGAVDGLYWRRTERAGQPTEYKMLDSGEGSNLGKEIDALYDPLLDYALKPGQKSGIIRKSAYEGRTTFLYLFELSDGRELEAEIDAATFHTLVIREPLELDEGRQQLVSEFSDYRKVDQIFIPFQTELSIDGEFFQSIMVDTVKANYGVLSSLFDLPAELR